MSRWPGGIVRKTPVTPSGPFQCSTASGAWTLADALYWRKLDNWPTQGKTEPVSQQAYTTAGTYSWVAPACVYSVSVVAVGGGGGGASSCCNYGGSGGGGGALAYANNITVVPGQSYSVVVGAGGCAGKRGPGVPLTAGKDGGFSSFNCTTVKAGGGVAGGINACRALKGCGGTVIYGTGGAGGLGGRAINIYAYGGAGGGGAGGYTGAGGAGRMLTDCNPRAGSAGAACSGAGGGAGSGGTALISGCFYYTGGSGGGGVGIKGKGSTGSGGAGRTGGGGGSSGANGTSACLCFGGQPGGAYGGGGGGSYGLNAGKGGVGAVRIIWPGSKRSFPSTCAGDK